MENRAKKKRRNDDVSSSPSSEQSGKRNRTEKDSETLEDALFNETSPEENGQQEAPVFDSGANKDARDLREPEGEKWVLVSKNAPKVAREKLRVYCTNEKGLLDEELSAWVSTELQDANVSVAEDVRIEKNGRAGAAGEPQVFAVFFPTDTKVLSEYLSAHARKSRVRVRGSKWERVLFQVGFERGDLVFESVGRAVCWLCKSDANERCPCKGPCFRCGEAGHERAQCSQLRKCKTCTEDASKTCSHVQCFLCGGEGHYSRECKAKVPPGPCTLVLKDLNTENMECLVSMIKQKYASLLNSQREAGGIKVWTSYGMGKAALYFKSRAGLLKVQNLLLNSTISTEDDEVLRPKIEEAVSPRLQQQNSQSAQSARHPSAQAPPKQPWKPNAPPQQPPNHYEWPPFTTKQPTQTTVNAIPTFAKWEALYKQVTETNKQLQQINEQLL